MEERKWFDQSQPQTLQSAVLLSYFNAVLAIFFSLLSPGAFSVLLVVILGCAVGAVGIANERRWGYWLCLTCAIVYMLAWLLFLFVSVSFSTLLNLLFAIILTVLLVHPQSREYRKIWFR